MWYALTAVNHEARGKRHNAAAGAAGKGGKIPNHRRYRGEGAEEQKTL